MKMCPMLGPKFSQTLNMSLKLSKTAKNFTKYKINPQKLFKSTQVIKFCHTLSNTDPDSFSD